MSCQFDFKLGWVVWKWGRCLNCLKPHVVNHLAIFCIFFACVLEFFFSVLWTLSITLKMLQVFLLLICWLFILLWIHHITIFWSRQGKELIWNDITFFCWLRIFWWQNNATTIMIKIEWCFSCKMTEFQFHQHQSQKKQRKSAGQEEKSEHALIIQSESGSNSMVSDSMKRGNFVQTEFRNCFFLGHHFCCWSLEHCVSFFNLSNLHEFLIHVFVLRKNCPSRMNQIETTNTKYGQNKTIHNLTNNLQKSLDRKCLAFYVIFFEGNKSGRKRECC